MGIDAVDFETVPEVIRVADHVLAERVPRLGLAQYVVPRFFQGAVDPAVETDIVQNIFPGKEEIILGHVGKMFSRMGDFSSVCQKRAGFLFKDSG